MKINFNKNKGINVTSSMRQNCILPTKDISSQKTFTKEDAAKDDSNVNLNKKNNTYLKAETIRKMILRLLIEKKMPKERLAEILKITVNNLELIISQDTDLRISEINLPLIKLYCETKWE